ncbi:CDP-alcohol phosphatidyltransferase family protein [Nitratireductor kimnyeongensis]|uniref:CDP-alcohol phosphatidyltransferase family protein n=1 Tax=Nitratireductor kimnyeongensis TaxID=430679 RepID=A0ABW0TCW4_9HYPH|nr:CDP-alcohol phosphatidyltransferase family protein [Nitratireductor kimnyeongensis]QZZ37528.1 CDP-alcohol phosphatidyltransferase family protein [Nitratireductor kimnyeongensis]
MNKTENRRPLASRDTGWAKAVARRLSHTSVTPNQISVASMVFAALAGLAFWQAGEMDGPTRLLLLVLSGLLVQCRLLCNLFDGMVAVEAGKGSPDGAFWNEFPDRVADIAILVGVGYGIGLPALGWAAGGFSVLTAYVRELGRACGQKADFSGPMAKPHRMAAITLAAALSLFEPLWNGRGEVLTVALWIVAIGAALTALRRSVRLVKGLRGQA